MLGVRRVAGLGVVAALFVAACSDGPSSPLVRSATGGAVLSKGSGSGGTSGGGSGSGGGGTGSGGGGGGGGGGQTGGGLVVTTPPTVDATGNWVGNATNAVATYTVSISMVQSSAGIISGTISNLSPGVVEGIEGTTSGTAVTLFIGNPCGSCTLATIFEGTVSADGTQLTGKFLADGSTYVGVRQ